MDVVKETAASAGGAGRAAAGGGGSHAAGSIGAAFQRFQEELDVQHDRWESLVKLSRDLTIESKRIIFLLHRVVDRAADVSSANECASRRRAVLEEAEQKLSRLLKSKVHAMADLLHGEDHFRYRRAYSPGIQEFVEALALHSVLNDGTVPSHSTVQKVMTFKQEDSSPARRKAAAASATPIVDEPHPCVADQLAAAAGTSVVESSATAGCGGTPTGGVGGQPPPPSAAAGGSGVVLTVYLSYDDYLLGLADTTGELMRLAINSISKGDRELPSSICHLVRDLYNGFVSASALVESVSARSELPQKTLVMRQSLGKIENACYALQVRGSERPATHLIVDVPVAE